MPSEQEFNNLKGKLNVLSGILRLGHEAFEKDALDTLGLHIVNNSRLLLNYDRATLVDMRGRSPSLTAVSGLPIPAQNSEYGTALRLFMSVFKAPEATCKLNLGSFDRKEAPTEALDFFKDLCDGRSTQDVFIIPLRPPGGKGGEKDVFVWVVEFFNGSNAAEESVIGLLAQRYAEAIWFKAGIPRKEFVPELISSKRMRPARLAMYFGVAIIIALVAFRVRQYAIADFEIAPDKESVCYSAIDGTLKEAVRTRGDYVKEGDVVIAFDTNELDFKLAAAEKDFELSSADLDMTGRKSFTTPDMIARAKLLSIKSEQDKVEIERCKWMLSKCTMRAPQAGVLIMEEREKLKGRPVRAGDKLFEVISPDSILAEIRLSERDASVLGDNMSIALYLHTQPERPMTGKVVSISPKPILTEDRLFCYVVKVKIDNPPEKLICGMRGVARVGGQKVSLGYYIFRSAVLWWRKI